MIIECPSCHSKYQYDEERFERKASKKIKCARCQQIFEIHNPAFTPPPSPLVEPGDRTYTAKDTSRSKPAPQDTTEQSPLPPTDKRENELQLPAGKRLSLAILDGPDAGSVYRIEKPRVTIGRSNADLTLNDSEASRNHAAIEVRDTNCRLLDLGSTNGTLVSGAKIHEPMEIADKSEFQVGATTLMLIVTDDA
ncbi:MAG TPA: FHA domain-containing protein [Thermoanaerobaculia bacterium]|nr:FHA domain-containing protein [Thermoanaerobaculia bacterium]